MSVRNCRHSPLLINTRYVGVQAGAIFVNISAEQHFTKVFTEAGLDEETVVDYTKEALESFETDAKRTFRNASENKLVNVGGRKFTNPDINVRRGAMTLKG